jgi:hypothetical protein
MSTKNSIILTDDNEHWYHECLTDNIIIEIEDCNLLDVHWYGEDIRIEIRGDSHLGKILFQGLSKIKENEFR